MSRHRRVHWRGGVLGVAWAGCACGALAGDPRLAEPRRAAREPAPIGTSPARSSAPELAVAAPAPAPSPAGPPVIAPVIAPPGMVVAPVDAPPEPRAVWRFRSSTPLCGAPAVTPGGLVYVASVEGFLHALGPDGGYRWSYGLGGMPVGAPAVDPAGQVFVATSEQRLYAFKPDGHLSWVQSSSTRFATPPVWAAPGLIYYAGRDRNLYSVAAWGSAPQAHWLGAASDGTLGTLSDGAVAVGLEAPEAQLFRRASLLARIPLAASAQQALLGGKFHWYAVTRAGLAAFDVATHALIWAAPARRAGLSGDERVLVLEAEGDLVWLDPASGFELHRVQLPADASAPPVVSNSGLALVPLSSGAVLVAEPKQGQLARIPLGAAPAWPPAWSETSRRLTAAAGGDVVGIDLSEWVGPLGVDPRDIDPRDTDAPESDEPLPSPLGAPRAASGHGGS